MESLRYWAPSNHMIGDWLTTVGRLLGHRGRETTETYALPDDRAIRDAAAKAATVISRTMGHRSKPPPLSKSAFCS